MTTMSPEARSYFSLGIFLMVLCFRRKSLFPPKDSEAMQGKGPYNRNPD